MPDISIVIILTVLFLSNTIYGLASPFLPKLLEDRGIEETWTGVIFAAYAVAYTIMAPIVGVVVDKYGHNRILTLGILVMAGSIACFGTTIYLESNTSLIGVSIALRMFQGR
jgi:MFS family permease